MFITIILFSKLGRHLNLILYAQFAIFLNTRYRMLTIFHLWMTWRGGGPWFSAPWREHQVTQQGQEAPVSSSPQFLPKTPSPPAPGSSPCTLLSWVGFHLCFLLLTLLLHYYENYDYHTIMYKYKNIQWSRRVIFTPLTHNNLLPV